MTHRSAIFHSTLLLLSYLRHARPEAKGTHDGIVPIVQVPARIDWQALADISHVLPGDSTINRAGLLENFVANGVGRLAIRGFCDGRQDRLDLIRYVNPSVCLRGRKMFRGNLGS